MTASARPQKETPVELSAEHIATIRQAITERWSYAHLHPAATELLAAFDASQERIAQLETALRDYGTHYTTCATKGQPWNPRKKPGPCDCGLAAALADSRQETPR